MSGVRNPASLSVLHVISGLDVGGTEGMLLRLILAHRRMGIRSVVVSLSGLGVIGERMRESGFEVFALNVRRLRAAVPPVSKLLRLAERVQPSVIQTWLPRADFAGAIIGALRPRLPVIWNIRMTNVARQRLGTRMVTQTANKYLSRFVPKAIVCCAQEALEEYVRLGFMRTRMVVIPNGFDVDVFRPDAQARAIVRNSLGVKDDELLVGIVGRFHPIKDHRSFVRAAGSIHARIPKARFLMVGEGVRAENPELAGWFDEASVRDICHCVGRRDDLPALYAAMDVNVLSSIGEGFPNVLGEAMACGVPCVATDVGGSKDLIGDTGSLVPPSDPQALSDAVIALLERTKAERVQLGLAARRRIQERFSIDAVSHVYGELYQRVAHDAEVST